MEALVPIAFLKMSLLLGHKYQPCLKTETVKVIKIHFERQRNNKGTMATACTVVIKKKTGPLKRRLRILTGVSINSTKDQPSKRAGNEAALTRAVRHVPKDSSDRYAVWHYYFRMTQQEHRIAADYANAPDDLTEI